jgi:hypothetical protein
VELFGKFYKVPQSFKKFVKFLQSLIKGYKVDIVMYKNTIIYLIGCKDTKISNTYIGHTTNFEQRCEDHKKCVSTSNRKLYSFIRNHGGWSNWYMKPLSKISCENKCEAVLEELYWYIKMDATLNICTPVSTISIEV